MATDLGSRDAYVSGAPARGAGCALSALTAEAASDQHSLGRSVSRTTPRPQRQTDSRNDALCYLRRARTDRARQRLAQRLALQLAHGHGIRGSEASLVPWLTRADCRDNGAALVQWVLQEMEACDTELLAAEDGAGRLLAMLSASLDNLLADVAEPQP